jgi:ankyrin repeat protein
MLEAMKNTILPIVALFACTALAQAAEPPHEMWDVIYGSSFKRLEQLKELIKQGADVNAPIGFNRMRKEGDGPSSRTPTAWPLDGAVQQGEMDMVKLLLASGAKFHGGELAMAAFARRENESLAMVTALLQAGADVNSPQRESGHTALIWASFNGYKNMVKLLLAQPGIQLDAIDIDGQTALMAAAEKGHAEIAEMLLQAGAKVSITDKRGETATALAQEALAKQQAMVSKLQSYSK